MTHDVWGIAFQFTEFIIQIHNFCIQLVIRAVFPWCTWWNARNNHICIGIGRLKSPSVVLFFHQFVQVVCNNERMESRLYMPYERNPKASWRHNWHGSVSNHQPHGCLLNRLFRRRSKKTSKLLVTGLCVGNSPEPVNSPHKGPVTWKMFPFDDVITGPVIQIAFHGMTHKSILSANEVLSVF